MVAVDHENEAKVFSALSTLPDNASVNCNPASFSNTTSSDVIRVAGEILVDLMRSAGGIEYEEARTGTWRIPPPRSPECGRREGFG